MRVKPCVRDRGALYLVSMRDKVARYLESGPRPAQQILREALNIEAPNSATAEVVLKSLLGADARFRNRHGLWSLAKSPPAPPVQVAALALDWTPGHPLCFRGAICFPDAGSSCEFLVTESAGNQGAEALGLARSRLDEHMLVAWSGRELKQWNRLLRLRRLPDWQGDTLAVSRLAARALPHRRVETLPDLAPLFDLLPPDADSPPARARFVHSVFRNLLEMVPEGRRSSAPELERWIEEGQPKVDFSRFGFGRELLASLPASPGIYLMRDRAGEVIYVGKSANLRRRVRSYFSARSLTDSKSIRIHNQLYSIECLTCTNEIEALLLEIRMIRDFRPAINLQSEVHERPAAYGRGRNLLIMVPAGDKAQIYFLKDGAFAARRQSLLGLEPAKSLAKKVHSVFFRVGAVRRREPKEAWESEIVASWFSANRRHLNYIDIDACGSSEAVARRLESYLKDPDRLAHKVYYRG
jgi:hypothetical protein